MIDNKERRREGRLSTKVNQVDDDGGCRRRPRVGFFISIFDYLVEYYKFDYCYDSYLCILYRSTTRAKAAIFLHSWKSTAIGDDEKT